MFELGHETCCEYVRISPSSQLAPSLTQSVNGIGVYKYLEDNSNAKSTERVYYNSAAGLFLYKNSDMGYWEVSDRTVFVFITKCYILYINI